MTDRRARLTSLMLATLIAVDLTLVIWAVFFPEWWFRAFHVDPAADTLALLFLRRCAANWGAFLLFQTVAFVRWRREPMWLAVVAGMRLSDIFTDASYVALSDAPTWFSFATLPFMGLLNLAFGVFLLVSFRSTRLSTERA